MGIPICLIGFIVYRVKTNGALASPLNLKRLALFMGIGGVALTIVVVFTGLAMLFLDPKSNNEIRQVQILRQVVQIAIIGVVVSSILIRYGLSKTTHSEVR